tara:strand:+ start:413 stop:991 length:579 start_codon:yes stop_codon:yes gene_type:complete
MTPRLRILSIGLALSLAYAIYDYVDRNNAKKSVVTKSKKPKKRARTAGVSATRAANLKKRFEKRIAKIGNKETAKPKSNFTPESDFLPISSDITSLDGWARNPFVEVYEPPSINEKIDINQNLEMDEQAGLLTLDGLIIETAILMGEKAYVTINGQTFTEGDQINNALIEKIDNEQITFKVGKTRIIKDVGT